VGIVVDGKVYPENVIVTSHTPRAKGG